MECNECRRLFFPSTKFLDTRSCLYKEINIMLIGRALISEKKLQCHKTVENTIIINISSFMLLPYLYICVFGLIFLFTVHCCCCCCFLSYVDFKDYFIIIHFFHPHLLTLPAVADYVTLSANQ